MCVQIHAKFDEIQRKIEIDVKKELTANHDSVTKNVDKVLLQSFAEIPLAYDAVVRNFSKLHREFNNGKPLHFCC